MLFVSHNMGSMQQLCTSGLLLQNGCIAYTGRIEDTINYYLKDSEMVESAIYNRDNNINAPIFLQRAELVDERNILSTNFGTQNHIILKLEFTIKEFLPLTNLLLTIVDKNQIRIGSINTRIENKKELSLQINPNFLVRGQYSFMIHIYQPGLTPYDVVENICPFTVTDSGTDLSHLETFNYGFVFPNMKWLW